MSTLLDTSTDRGRHVEARLRNNPVAWLTTVRPSGQPVSVPVWFLWDDGTVLIYSRPESPKLRNLAQNPRVCLTLDGTDGGVDVIRIEGTARHVEDHPAAHVVRPYAAKYSEAIATIGFDSPEDFARAYSAPIVLTPSRLRV